MKQLDFSPLEKWEDGLWGWSNSKDCNDDDCQEVRIERYGNHFELIFASGPADNWEVYRGDIPNREFFVNLLKYGEGIKELKLV